MPLRLEGDGFVTALSQKSSFFAEAPYASTFGEKRRLGDVERVTLPR